MIIDNFGCYSGFDGIRTEKWKVNKIWLNFSCIYKVTLELSVFCNIPEVVDGQVKLLAPADSVYVRFTNTAESYREVYALGLLA